MLIDHVHDTVADCRHAERVIDCDFLFDYYPFYQATCITCSDSKQSANSTFTCPLHQLSKHHHGHSAGSSAARRTRTATWGTDYGWPTTVTTRNRTTHDRRSQKAQPDPRAVQANSDGAAKTPRSRSRKGRNDAPAVHCHAAEETAGGGSESRHEPTAIPRHEAARGPPSAAAGTATGTTGRTTISEWAASRSTQSSTGPAADAED